MDNRTQIEYHCYQIKDLLISLDDELKDYPKNTHWSLGIGNDKTSKGTSIAYEIEKDIEAVLHTRVRGRLDLSDETPTKVSEQNLREEKLKQIVEKLKDK